MIAGRRIGVLAATAALLTGCGIGGDDAPRDIVNPAPAADVDDARSAITATATTTIYLVGHDDDGRFALMPVARDTTETISNAVQALFDGPTPRELNADLRSAIPATTRLVKAVPNNDVVTIDVSADLAQLSGSALVDAVGQIVLTATDVTGITRVVITIDDTDHPWPLPDGTTTLEPLARDDYDELLPTHGATAVTAPPVESVAPTTVAETTTTVAPSTSTEPVATEAPIVTDAAAEPPPPETDPPAEMGPAPDPS